MTAPNLASDTPALPTLPEGTWVVYRQRCGWEFAQLHADGREVGGEPPPETDVHRCVWKSGELTSRGLATAEQIRAVHAAHAAERTRVDNLPNLQNSAHWGPRPW